MKRGTLTLEQLIRITLTVAFILLAVAITWSIIKKIASNDTEHDHTVRNVEMLFAKLEAIADDPRDYAYSSDTIFLKSDYTLVGFDTDWVTSENKEQDLRRPEKCRGQSCLCLFSVVVDDEYGGSAEEVVRCHLFAEDVKLIGAMSHIETSLRSLKDLRGATRSDVSIDQGALPSELRTPNEYLFLYGGRFIGTTKSYHLEKTKSGGETFVLVTPVTEATKLRPKYMQVCSEDSDDVCVGERADDVVEDSGTLYACKKTRETDRCYAQEVAQCDDGKDIAEGEPCSCDGKEYRTGFCYGTTSQYHSPVSCEEIEDCNDYCDIEVSMSCNFKEQTLCEADFCKKNCKFVTHHGRDSRAACIPA